jgi:ATP-binding cassette subfamily C protein
VNATDTRLPVADGRRTAAVLWRELRGRRGLLVVSAVLAAVGAGLELVTPAVLGRIVDDVSDGGDHTSLWLYGLTIVAASVGAAVLGVLGILVASRVMERLLATLRGEAHPAGTADAAAAGGTLRHRGPDLPGE